MVATRHRRTGCCADRVAPGVVLTFDTVSIPVNLEDNIRDGILEIAIDRLPVERGPFVNKKLFEDQLVLVARRDHPSVGTVITMEDFRQQEIVTLRRRGQIEHTPRALRELYELGLNVAVRVSELLEIPAVVASTDLLGIFPSSMGPLIEKRLVLRVLPLPLELPAVPVYMIWHEKRRTTPNTAGCATWWRLRSVASLIDQIDVFRNVQSMPISARVGSVITFNKQTTAHLTQQRKSLVHCDRLHSSGSKCALADGAGLAGTAFFAKQRLGLSLLEDLSLPGRPKKRNRRRS
jgi:LysR substrate binding domain